MAELPLRVQDKIESYISILAPRYPSNIPSWKISVGYADFRDAESDTTPVTTIYTLKNSQPKLGDNIFSDSSKKVLYNGASLWFNLFSSLLSLFENPLEPISFKRNVLSIEGNFFSIMF